MKAKGFRKSAGYIILLLCALAATWLVLNQRYVVDQLTVWQYHPDTDVKAIVDKSDMSGKGKFLFYASQPTIDGTQAFNQYCEKSEPQSAILGCYNNLKIYIYDVDDPKLDGIEEVTAAHEMLHAAWDRLDGPEKTRISKLLEATYMKLNDKNLNQRMEYYARTEPTERENELHSILGTEFSNLGQELETYFDTYFDDRGVVVGLHQQYASVFESVQQKGETLATRLNQLAADINQQTKSYNAAVSALNKDIMNFNQQANNGSFSSRAEFNTTRTNLLARSKNLEQERRSINEKIKTYQAVRKQLEAINSQAEALNRSIDSSLAPAPSVDE